MLSVAWLIVAVVLTVLLTTWVTVTLTRLDRLHARVDAAQAALDAQLVRRAAALQHLAEMPNSGMPPAATEELAALARSALVLPLTERQAVENQLGRAITELAELRQ